MKRKSKVSMTVPLGFKEISIEDEASGEAVRFVLA